MEENYVFSGVGHAIGKYLISNEELEEALNKGFLEGFSWDRIEHSRDYREFLSKNPNISPFIYFAEHVMGFKTRLSYLLYKCILEIIQIIKNKNR